MKQQPISDERLRGLARALPERRPSEARVEAVRTSLLSVVADPPRRERRRGWAYVCGAVAAAALALLYVSTRPHAGLEVARIDVPVAQPRRAAIEASRATRYTHVHAGDDEVVTLARGALKLRVPTVPAGERFRVIAGGAEVETTGATFDIDVGDSGVRRLTVHSGRVALRVHGQATVLLGAGESWRPKRVAITTHIEQRLLPAPVAVPARTTVPAPQRRALVAPATTRDGVRPTLQVTSRPRRLPAPAPLVAPRRLVAPAPTPRSPAISPLVPLRGRWGRSPQVSGAKRSVEGASINPITKPSDAEQAFKAAWSALRGKRYRAAATGFARAIAVSPDGALTPDARYWQAIALLRANDTTSGQSALATFLRQHPHDIRAGEASTMLGWLLVRAGRPDRARPYFAAGLRDKRATVRNSAQAGMSAITR